MNGLAEIENIADLVRYIRRKLIPVYGEGETDGMISLIFQYLKEWSKTQTIINYDLPASPYLKEKTEDILQRLKNNEPIQYILGKVNFYGMYLDVDRSTLIPRPETEQMVDMIVRRFSSKYDLRILDIGTGSGAIALALSRNIPFSKVSAIDISDKALIVANKNAENLNCRIEFIHADIFKYDIQPESFDIIVSNPPYICESESKDMDRNVLEFEPHNALFVPDNAPLIFYKRIAEIAKSGLTENGSLYLEINPIYAEELKDMLKNTGYHDIDIINDIYNRERFITADLC